MDSPGIDHDLRIRRPLEHLAQDLGFAIRQVRTKPGFTAIAVSVLALGICASVSIFAFVDAALLRPLPYANPSRLVGVFESVQMFPRSNLSYPDYLDWKALNGTLASLDIYQRAGFLLSASGGPEPVRGARVSDGFFRTLGVAPVLGRDFYPGEDLPGAQRSALLSYAAWQQRYGGSPDVLGRSVVLSRVPTVIIGVLPREFHFAPAEPAEFWTAFHAESGCDLRRSCHGIYGVGRLKDGVSIQAASADLRSVAQRLEERYPDSNRGQGAAVASLTEVIVGDIRPVLLVLLGGAGLLLLIAVVNVAGLLLVRFESRRREFAVRAALGASPGRLTGQLVAEALVLAAASSLLGVAAARWAMQLLAQLVPADLMARTPSLQNPGLNVRVAAVAAAISLLSMALFSLTPMVRLRFADLREGQAGGRGSGMAWRRLGSRLVVVELATAMVLLVGAGLLGKSLSRLLHVDLGLQPDRLVTVDVAAPRSSYAPDAKASALAREIMDRIASLPGVESVAISTNGVPVTGNGNTTWFRVLGRPWHGEHNEVPERDVTPGYFRTLGARLLRGRDFAETDAASRPRVAIINETFARQYFPGEEPLGQHLSYLSTPPVPIEIVGIVADVRQGPLDAPIPPVLYVPFDQSTDTYFGVVVRTSHADGSLVPTLTAAIKQIDPEIVTVGAMTMTGRIHDSPSAYLHRSSAWLVGGFAALALLLGAVGLYGVVAYSVSQRTREIGVRMALGAAPAAVHRLILREAGWLAAVGIAGGLACAVAAATWMRALLFGVQSWDVPTLAGVAAVLGLSALVASYIPARRAAGVNPIEALRAE